MKSGYAKRSIAIVSVLFLTLVAVSSLTGQLQWSRTLIAILCLGGVSAILLYMGIQALSTVPASSHESLGHPANADVRTQAPMARIDPELVNQLRLETDRLQDMIDDLIEKQRSRPSTMPGVSLAPVPHVKTKVKIDDPLNN